MRGKRKSPDYPVGYVVPLTVDTLGRADDTFLPADTGRKSEVVYTTRLAYRLMTLFGSLFGTKMNLPGWRLISGR